MRSAPAATRRASPVRARTPAANTRRVRTRTHWSSQLCAWAPPHEKRATRMPAKAISPMKTREVVLPFVHSRAPRRERAPGIRRRTDGQEDGEEVREEAERGIHEADDAELGAVGSRRQQADSADGSHQETVGLHQEEQAAGHQEQAEHQG